MKVLFASPTYGPVEPEAVKSHRIAIMHAMNNGHTFIGDASPDKMKFDVARNMVARAAVETDADYVFWCDSDVLLPMDAITRLLSVGKDFVSGIYYQREGDHYPMIGTLNGDAFSWMVRWPENVIAPIDGCGFGCVITSLKMLRAMEEKDKESGGWFNYLKFSEDLDFCVKAKKCGFQLYVDTGVVCGHLMAPRAATIEQFKQKHPEFFGGTDGDIASKQVSETGVSEAGQGGGDGLVSPTPVAVCEVG